ncbi:hypothetical protein [Acidithiobacillus thiooxidans]|uniref:Uncharacterized protein n=2 Tax=Acidithiobacillus thiooxidans TaxID=930 RepID=A0A1C2J3A8_ACITH|nr:hypothetical protein [Acidithiobacillus thiooxidans]MDX5936826.1 hypothetical protein [Acidithiobacillus thiooxidans]MDX5936868.1 hypothetical protein [Acidithiobacillus thiooxidans]OCX69656.1 hypothetical protein A6M23_15145 [Acidithiobacillus thiooxidans]OCX82731.1 hypothetical protein A6P08_11610 [Acidithiobacillus thiooxidans]TQN49242.1 hypothetical protein DLNHIDIE_03422 [Acidithiobacillus thiooxidans ATCC 19377]
MVKIAEVLSPPITKKRGRKPKGDRPMTAAERAAVSRFRRRYPMEGYSGKSVSVMLSGPAHAALDDLITIYSDKSQKEIIDLALISLLKSQRE